MRSLILLALALVLAGCGLGAADAVAVGSAAPAIEGKKWFTATGAAPDYKGKVHVVEFWFAG